VDLHVHVDTQIACCFANEIYRHVYEVEHNLSELRMLLNTITSLVCNMLNTSLYAFLTHECSK
jgi:hypothetical protein